METDALPRARKIEASETYKSREERNIINFEMADHSSCLPTFLF